MVRGVCRACYQASPRLFFPENWIAFLLQETQAPETAQGRPAATRPALAWLGLFRTPTGQPEPSGAMFSWWHGDKRHLFTRRRMAGVKLTPSRPAVASAT